MIRAAVLILLLWPATLAAQGTASLVADSVFLDGQDLLIAEGNVEAFYDGARLSAARIVYDRRSDRLRIDGPIFIQDSDGMILTADAATLDPQLQNGMLRGARLVLERQLQLAANQIDRVDGRFSQLYKSAVTSCTVCSGQSPLWEIRAERVVHDEEARQLYFTNAQLRVKGLPIFWLPRMRLPDPTVERATGFLIPRIRTSDRLGTGLKLPYFITLGPSRDLRLTPYISNSTRTLEARYRQAFLNGTLDLNGAVTNDTLLDGENRAYLFGNGTFDLGRDYRLDFDIEAVTDDAYLLDYGYSDKDRLDSRLALTRVLPNTLFVADITYYQSLREDERNSTLPPIVMGFRYDRRIRPAGGTLDLSVTGDALIRYGSDVGPDGRDVARLGAEALWRRDWIVGPGLLGEASLGLSTDHYRITDSTAFPDQITRTVPTAGLTFRYPLTKSTPRATHLLEPVLALAWSDQYGDRPPNEDATRPEFDTGNLFALSRLPGEDVAETGFRAAAGLHWRRLGRLGTRTSLTFGRVWQETPDAAFAASSGLDSNWSDWLIAGDWESREGLRIEARALITDTLDTTLAEGRVNWQTDDLTLAAAYIWQNPDPGIGRDRSVSEWSFDGTVQVTPSWAVSFDTRYDVATDRPARAGLGIEWRNECVTVDLSVSRRYTSSTTVEPSTDYGLSVELTGFSAGGTTPRPVTRCNN